MKARKKPVEIEFFTFEEVVAFGKLNNPDSIHGDRAWSFEFKGRSLTHENDDAYIISTLEGNHLFTSQDVLIVGVKGEIYPCKKDIFEMTYEFQAENFETQLQKEFSELRAKNQKLYDFMQKPDFESVVGEKQADLLLAQYQCMNGYLTVLGIRMKNLNIEIKV